MNTSPELDISLEATQLCGPQPAAEVQASIVRNITALDIEIARLKQQLEVTEFYKARYEKMLLPF